MRDPQALQDYLYDNIPLSQAAGIKVAETATRVVLTAPLAPNLNHKRTAFGGSLYTIAVTAGWSWIAIKVREHGLDGHIVIASSTMEYLAPALSDFEARCEANPVVFEAARRHYAKKGKVRIKLDVGVYCEGKKVADFHGCYALIQDAKYQK